MKCAFMTFSTPDLPLVEVLALARRLGYDGVEPRIQAGHRHGLDLYSPASVRREARAMADETGVAYAGVATSCQYADPAAREGHIEDMRRAVELAADIGAPCIRVFGGTLPETMARADAVAQVADALGGVAEHARRHGVAVCLETHDDWCDPENVAAVMGRVDHPAIAVNWDIMHPVRTAGVTMDQAFETLRPWVRHAHVHDGNLGHPLVHVPIGEGAIDHRRAVELLAGAGYEGYLSGEWIGWEPAEVHLPRELARLRALIEATQV